MSPNIILLFNTSEVVRLPVHGTMRGILNADIPSSSFQLQVDIQETWKQHWSYQDSRSELELLLHIK